MKRTAVAEARRVRGPDRARPARGARRSAGRSSPCSPRRSRCSSSPGSPPRASRSSSSRSSSTASAPSRATSVTITIDLEARTPIERLELHVPLPRRPRARRRREPGDAAARLGEERTVELKVRCKRWGAYVVGELFLRAHDRLDLFGYEGTLDRRHAAEGLPARRAAALARSRRSRRRSSPATRSRAPRARASSSPTSAAFEHGDSLRRINWRASARRGELWVNELHPERNTDVIIFLDTFVEAREGGRVDARLRRPRRGHARRPLPRAQGPRRPDQLRRLPQLAAAVVRARPALPHRRLAARHGDHPQLRVEGRRRDPAAHAAAEGARARRLAAARRARGDDAARPARARLRPRRASRSRRSRSRRARRASARSSRTGCGSMKREALRARYRARRRPGRGMARRHAARRSARGGGSIQATSQVFARIAAALVAVLGAAGIGGRDRADGRRRTGSSSSVLGAAARRPARARRGAAAAVVDPVAARPARGRVRVEPRRRRDRPVGAARTRARCS